MNDETEKVRELMHRRRAALLAGDAEALAALLCADYRYVDSLGRSLSREVYLTSRRSGELMFDEQILEDMLIAPLGEHAMMATVMTRDRFRFRGEEISAQYMAVHVCVKSGDGWVFLFGQSTPVETPPS